MRQYFCFCTISYLATSFIFAARYMVFICQAAHKNDIKVKSLCKNLNMCKISQFWLGCQKVKLGITIVLPFDILTNFIDDWIVTDLKNKYEWQYPVQPHFEKSYILAVHCTDSEAEKEALNYLRGRKNTRNDRSTKKKSKWIY